MRRIFWDAIAIFGPADRRARANQDQSPASRRAITVRAAGGQFQ